MMAADLAPDDPRHDDSDCNEVDLCHCGLEADTPVYDGDDFVRMDCVDCAFSFTDALTSAITTEIR